MITCEIGNLYICKFEKDIFQGFSFPILEWNEREKNWTLAKKYRFEKVINDYSTCLYLGKTNANHIGAFLLQDSIVGIEFSHIRLLNENK